MRTSTADFQRMVMIIVVICPSRRRYHSLIETYKQLQYIFFSNDLECQERILFEEDTRVARRLQYIMYMGSKSIVD